MRVQSGRGRQRGAARAQGSNAQPRPWEAESISRASWYRHEAGQPPGTRGRPNKSDANHNRMMPPAGPLGPGGAHVVGRWKGYHAIPFSPALLSSRVSRRSRCSAAGRSRLRATGACRVAGGIRGRGRGGLKAFPAQPGQGGVLRPHHAYPASLLHTAFVPVCQEAGGSEFAPAGPLTPLCTPRPSGRPARLGPRRPEHARALARPRFPARKKIAQPSQMTRDNLRKLVYEG